MDVTALKKKHGNLFIVQIGPMEIIFTLLSWKDYKMYSLLLERPNALRVYIYDEIFKLTVLSEEILDTMYQQPAGVVDSVVDLVLTLSGNRLETEEDVLRLNEDIDLARGMVEANIYDQYSSLICWAFPAYTPEDIDKFNWPEVLRHLLMAEFLLVKQGKIPEGSVNLRPKEEEKKTSMADQILADTQRAVRDDPSLINPRNSSMTPDDKRQRMLEVLQQKRAAKAV